jgi:hypothetical protein
MTGESFCSLSLCHGPKPATTVSSPSPASITKFLRVSQCPERRWLGQCGAWGSPEVVMMANASTGLWQLQHLQELLLLGVLHKGVVGRGTLFTKESLIGCCNLNLNVGVT